MSTEATPQQQGNFLEAVHKWGPWLGALFLFVVLTTGKAVLGYAKDAGNVERLESRVASLEAQSPQLGARVDVLGERILRRLDRVDKSLARVTCKIDGPGASCDAAMVAIGAER